jgi:hypothetical protein
MIKFNKTQHGMTNWKKQDQKIKKNKNKKKTNDHWKKPWNIKKNQAHAQKQALTLRLFIFFLGDMQLKQIVTCRQHVIYHITENIACVKTRTCNLQYVIFMC